MTRPFLHFVINNETYETIMNYKLWNKIKQFTLLLC